MPRFSQSKWVRYGLAVASIVLAVGVRMLLDPLLGDAFPFATLLLAILVTAWFGGLSPALVATVLGAGLSMWFLLPPRNGFAVEGFENRYGLAVYLAVGVGTALLGGRMRSAWQRAEGIADE